ncbi:terminase small subunit [Rubrivivax benzoatilyticus]|uniref:Terminase small subunit n=1 Tax=Rubrivivax benzoatilyticus TaxID=316997 RepID=A0ABX0HVS6_9BURK|nr:terminase small subunit [Rubrivivax benzoatilyticus]NHK97479.1 hypothetical protein [Rubrivivax benzoatilyticus]NHL22826.1 hypothetical protein [Rubrivivax benzoatilyticus]
MRKTARKATTDVVLPTQEPPGSPPAPTAGGRDDVPTAALLPPREEAFATLLAKGRNQTDAYLEVFPRSRTWKRKTVWTRAHELASSAQIRERVHYLMAAAAKANEVDVALVLKEYLTRLRADPRELTEIRVSACRYCWGAGHRRQFTDGELEDARARHDDLRAACVAAGKDDPGEFDERGGGGYSRALKPNADCPTCGGDGEARVRLRDSETYSEGAIALFGGVKETKEGIEVKLADRDHALMQLARHVNFFEQDNARDLNLTVDVAELDAFYDEAMRKSREAGERARARGRAIAAEAAGLREPAADG